MTSIVRLRDERELFEQPERSPLDEDYEPWCVAPAAEYLVQVLRGEGVADILVETPDADQARAGLARYATARADELTREIHGEVRHALWALIPTGGIFALTVALSRLAANSSSHWFSTTVSEALVVIGWVVLWAPVAILGTDIWILLARRRACGKLAAVEVRAR